MTDIRMATFVLFTILWRLWDARNAEVFRGERPSAVQIINHVIDDLHIWEKRFIIIKKKKKTFGYPETTALVGRPSNVGPM